MRRLQFLFCMFFLSLTIQAAPLEDVTVDSLKQDDIINEPLKEDEIVNEEDETIKNVEAVDDDKEKEISSDDEEHNTSEEIYSDDEDSTDNEDFLNDEDTTKDFLNDEETTEGFLNDEDTTEGFLNEEDTTEDFLNDEDTTEGFLNDEDTTEGFLNDEETTEDDKTDREREEEVDNDEDEEGKGGDAADSEENIETKDESEIAPDEVDDPSYSKIRKLYNKLRGKTISLKSHFGRYIRADKDGGAFVNTRNKGPLEKFKVVLVGGFKIALLGAHNKYLTAYAPNVVIANECSMTKHAIFRVIYAGNLKIALKSVVTNRYLSALPNGKLEVNRGSIGPREKFNVVINPPPSTLHLRWYKALHGKTISLKSYQSKYVVAFPNGNAFVNRVNKVAWRKFKVIYRGGFNIALKSAYNKYLSVYSGKTVKANFGRIGARQIFRIYLFRGGKVALRSAYTKKFLSAQPNGRLEANRRRAGPWEKFSLQIIPTYNRRLMDIIKSLNGKTISLKSSHGKYVVALPNGNAFVNRVNKGAWEKFKVIYRGGFNIALKSAHNKYLSVYSGKTVKARFGRIGVRQVFRIYLFRGGKVALRSAYTKKFLSAQPNGRLEANRRRAGPWEKFSLQIIPTYNRRLSWYQALSGKTISLKSHHNRYVVAEANGQVNANRRHKNAWEKFKVELLGGFKIRLKGNHGKYLVASGSDVKANQYQKTQQGIFQIVFLNKHIVGLKSIYNGRYVSAQQNGKLHVNRQHLHAWETFKLEY